MNDQDVELLSAFCRNKVVAGIESDASGEEITLLFRDGSSARLSTLGGVEVEELTLAITKGSDVVARQAGEKGR